MRKTLIDLDSCIKILTVRNFQKVLLVIIHLEAQIIFPRYLHA